MPKNYDYTITNLAFSRGNQQYLVKDSDLEVTVNPCYLIHLKNI